MKTWLASICMGLLVTWVCIPGAGAEGPKHTLIQTIKSSSEDIGALKDPCGAAVDSKGRVYVGNYYHRNIQIFEKSPPPIELYGRVALFASVDPSEGGSKVPLNGPCGVAVDSVGNLYVNNYHRNVVKYTSSPPGSTNYSVDAIVDSNHPTGVAVDPTTDHLYVVARTYVAKYEAPVIPGEEPVQKIGLGTLEDGYGIAVSDFPGTDGWVYVADAASDTVKVYDPAFNPLVPIRTITGAGTPRGFFHLDDGSLAIDKTDGHLYVTDNLEPGFEHPELAVHEFSAAGNYRGRLPHAEPEGAPTLSVNGVPAGVATANGEVFVTSGNFDSAELLIFGPSQALETRILTVEKSGLGSGTVARFPPGWIRCGSACEGELNFESTHQLIATPDVHNRFVGWSGCKPVSDDACQVTMDTDVTVNAEFEPIPPQSLAVSVSGTGSGSVRSAPAGIECGSDCAADFDEGSTVTLIASPVGGSRLSAWDGCDAEPTPSTCSVTMSGARSVEAEFEPLPQPPPPPPETRLRTLTVSSTAIGEARGRVLSVPAGIACGTACSQAYEEGSVVVLLADPAPGSSFLGWGGCDDPAANRCVLRLGTDRTVVAAFTPGRPGPLRLRRVDMRGAAAAITLTVPVAGTLTATAGKLRPATALPLRPGKVTLHLRLNRAGQRELRRAREGALRVRAVLSLTPFDGGESVRLRKTLLFGED